MDSRRRTCIWRLVNDVITRLTSIDRFDMRAELTKTKELLSDIEEVYSRLDFSNDDFLDSIERPLSLANKMLSNVRDILIHEVDNEKREIR